ncbi:gamma-glutamyl kinase [Paracoccus sp. MBLB3053]|uniref:Gamma-glutamyl kinase n=1 Tax=Paracoccus aurantius TaxID=3073814 RepID=A0ABU2HR32_9RHOB|nr:gamma-glutamyl kinase [Paracoccus sp. MBLB3053]MDS9467498.1 gamma-glutamyl kinase [Paracoccus sp. MBLB3053]
MLIFIEPRIVLLSVPKTGTTALEMALAPRAEIAFRARPEIKHLNQRQYLKRIAPLLAPLKGAPFESVAVVREPLDWLRSWYRFRTREELIGHPNSTVKISFEQFIRDYLAEGPRPDHARLGRQSEFLADAEGKPSVRHVFRYEAMPALVRFLERRLKTTIDLPRRNVSPEAVTDLTPETEAMAREALASEYEVWEAARQEEP